MRSLRSCGKRFCLGGWCLAREERALQATRLNSGGLWLTEEGFYESLGIEGFYVFGGFTEAYEFYGDVELVVDGDHHAAFGGAV